MLSESLTHTTDKAAWASRTLARGFQQLQLDFVQKLNYQYVSVGQRYIDQDRVTVSAILDNLRELPKMRYSNEFFIVLISTPIRINNDINYILATFPGLTRLVIVTDPVLAHQGAVGHGLINFQLPLTTPKSKPVINEKQRRYNSKKRLLEGGTKDEEQPRILALLRDMLAAKPRVSQRQPLALRDAMGLLGDRRRDQQTRFLKDGFLSWLMRHVHGSSPGTAALPLQGSNTSRISFIMNTTGAHVSGEGVGHWFAVEAICNNINLYDSQVPQGGLQLNDSDMSLWFTQREHARQRMSVL
jgi:hypothetical protein